MLNYSQPASGKKNEIRFDVLRRTVHPHPFIFLVMHYLLYLWANILKPVLGLGQFQQLRGLGENSDVYCMTENTELITNDADQGMKDEICEDYLNFIYKLLVIYPTSDIYLEVRSPMADA